MELSSQKGLAHPHCVGWKPAGQTVSALLPDQRPQSWERRHGCVRLGAGL